MLSCLGLLAKAAASFRRDDESTGHQILSSVVNCPHRGTCATRNMCSTAANALMTRLPDCGGLTPHLGG